MLLGVDSILVIINNMRLMLTLTGIVSRVYHHCHLALLEIYVKFKKTGTMLPALLDRLLQIINHISLLDKPVLQINQISKEMKCDANRA